MFGLHFVAHVVCYSTFPTCLQAFELRLLCQPEGCHSRGSCAVSEGATLGNAAKWHRTEPCRGHATSRVVPHMAATAPHRGTTSPQLRAHLPVQPFGRRQRLLDLWSMS